MLFRSIFALFFADPSAVCFPLRRHSSSSLPLSIHPITSHFCSFLCRSVRSPLHFPTPFIFFLTVFPSPYTAHFCSFLCGSVRSPLPFPTPFTSPLPFSLHPIPFNYIDISHLPDTFIFPRLIHLAHLWDFQPPPDAFIPPSQIFVFVSAPSLII